MRVYSLLRLFWNGNQEIAAVRASSECEAAKRLLRRASRHGRPGLRQPDAAGVSYCVALNYP